MHQVVIASWREQVPASLAAQADQWQGKIKVAWNTAVLVTGQALRAMKQEMPHGSFESWWREELKLKDRKTVADLMAASEVLEEAPMDSPLVSLPPRTLGILKRGGGKAVSTAAQRMADGERITEAKAKAIVQPAEEAPESKCGDSPQMDVTLPTAEELMARVLNLEAENASLRALLEAQPVAEPVAADAVIDGSVSSMGTEASRVADADFEEISRLVCCIEAIHSRNLTTDGSGLHQQQWRGLSQQYKSIKYCADLRWSRLRAEMEREHEAFLEQLDNALPEELKAQPAVAAPAAPSADVATLEKKIGRLQKRLKDRDRTIKNLKKIMPKGVTNLPNIELEPWEETDEERLRVYPTEHQEQMTKYSSGNFVPAEPMEELLSELSGRLNSSLGAYETDEVQRVVRTLRWITYGAQKEFLDRGNAVVSDTINPIAVSQLRRSQDVVIDV